MKIIKKEMFSIHNVAFIGKLDKLSNNISSHKHNIWEIVYYTKGTGIITVGDISYKFKEGNIICLPPNISHFETSITGFYNYHMGVNSALHFDIGKVYKFKDNSNKDILNIFSNLYNSYFKRQSNWKNICESLLNTLTQYLYSENISNNKHTLVESLENTIISNVSNCKFDLTKEINNLPVSADHLRRLFKKQTGQTPRRYLLNLRIKQASNLLNSSTDHSLKIQEIGKMVGFDDPYYFSRMFKKTTGKSPSNYS